MTKTERIILSNILYDLFLDCVDEETDAARVTIEIPGFTKKIIVHIIFDITEMEEKEK